MAPLPVGSFRGQRRSKIVDPVLSLHSRVTTPEHGGRFSEIGGLGHRVRSYAIRCGDRPEKKAELFGKVEGAVAHLSWIDLANEARWELDRFSLPAKRYFIRQER